MGGTSKTLDSTTATVAAPSSISTGSFRSNGSSTPQPMERQMSGLSASACHGASTSNQDATTSSKHIDVPTATLVNTSDDPVSPVLSGTLKRQKASSPGIQFSLQLCCFTGLNYRTTECCSLCDFNHKMCFDTTSNFHLIDLCTGLYSIQKF